MGKSLIVACALAAVLVFAAMSSASITVDGAEVTVRYAFWGGTQDQYTMERPEEAFNRSQDRIEVIAELRPVGVGGFYATIVTQTVGGAAPDIFTIGEAAVPSLHPQGLTLDLTPYIARDGLDLTQFWDVAVRQAGRSTERRWPSRCTWGRSSSTIG